MAGHRAHTQLLELASAHRLSNMVPGGPVRSKPAHYLRHHAVHLGPHLRDVPMSFIRMIALVIISSEFQYEKIVENFKFLQWLPGLALYNLLYHDPNLVWPRSWRFSSAP